MTDIEIPYPEERKASRLYRFLEILPGLSSWSLLALPIILSLISPVITAYFVIAYILVWFSRSVSLNLRVLQGHKAMEKHMKMEWTGLLPELEDAKNHLGGSFAKKYQWHKNNLTRLAGEESYLKPSEVIHLVIIATYNESLDVLEPTVLSLLDSDIDPKQLILCIAYEERGGEDTKKGADYLVEKYGGQFLYALAVAHPDNIPGEIIGKGGNITFAGRHMQTYFEEHDIDPLRVMVTTLDADNRPHKKYFTAVSYAYVICPNKLTTSFQPIAMYMNNIWDVPPMMRVIATGNSFWYVALALRPHMQRNFSSHSQGMASLIGTNFWSVRTIVEDGHQFWRTYFAYDGQHEVFPIFLPIYQDAVLASSLKKTLKAQFIQLRRWAWGASDISYVAMKGFFTKNNVPKRDLWVKFLRLYEGHLGWATQYLILAYSGLLPPLLNPTAAQHSAVANQLPLVASLLQRIALVFLLATTYVTFRTLPPKPKRYKNWRYLGMALQWVFLPVTTVLYNTFAGLNSQTRLMFGKYLGKFDVTEKAVKK